MIEKYTIELTEAVMFLQRSGINIYLSGSTCVLCLRIDREIYTANCGDSRSVVGYRNSKGKVCVLSSELRIKIRSTRFIPPQKTQIVVQDLSHDHKPESTEELARIKSLGGVVEPYRLSSGSSIGIHSHSRFLTCSALSPKLTDVHFTTYRSSSGMG